MKKVYWILIILVVALIIAVIFLRGSEDTWIKDGNGSYVKHGNPSETPDDVSAQQSMIDQAKQLYAQKKQEGMVFSSQCLGTIGESVKYAVDIVHVPRSGEDNLVENQCEDYRAGKANNFIELDKDGNIVRVV